MSLFSKILGAGIVVFVGVVLIIACGNTWMQLRLLEEHIIRDYEVFASYMTHAVETASAEARWPVDGLRELTSRKDFLFWWVVRDDGVIHLADKASFMGTATRDYFPQVAESRRNQTERFVDRQKGIGIIAKPFSVEERPWTFWFGFSTRVVDEARNAIVLKTVPIFGVGILVLAGALFVTMRYLTRPIGRLLRGAEVIGRGDLSHRVDIATNDELGELASAFNGMAGNLQKTTTSIERLNEEVERRKAVEESLRRSEESYRLLAENASDVIWTIGFDGRLTYVSPSTTDLQGYSSEEGLKLGLEDLLTPSSLRMARNILKEASDLIRMDKDDAFNPPPVCLEAIRKDGSTVWTESQISLLREPQGRAVGILAVTRDITLRRQAEKEREKLQEQVLQSGKMAAVGQLAGGVAHEINNPIGIILGFAESARKRIDSDNPLSYPLESIRREAVRCKNLVADLLTFSRNSYEDRGPVAVNETIEEALLLVETRAGIEEVEVTRDFQADLPAVSASKNQLQQVLINLCNNALDAITDKGEITITTRLVGEQVEIAVRDTGMGIRDEDKDRLFEPFFTTKEVGQGTGLGLSLCYEIVQKHKGTMEFESRVGEGSAFRVKLPVCPAEISSPVSNVRA